MPDIANDLLTRLKDALLSLVPITAIVVGFQGLVIREMPDDVTSLVVGMAVVALGIAVFLQGLDLSVFPLGKSLAAQFTRRRAFGPLLAFGFSIRGGGASRVHQRGSDRGPRP